MSFMQQMGFDFDAPPPPSFPGKQPDVQPPTAVHNDFFKRNRDGSRKLEDFGEDLGNTRKGVKRTHQSVEVLNDDELERELKANGLEKVWPKSSITELAEKDKEGAATLWILRDSIPKRIPQGRSSFIGYLCKVDASLKFFKAVESGAWKGENYYAPSNVQRLVFDVFHEYRPESAVLLSKIPLKYWNHETVVGITEAVRNNLSRELPYDANPKFGNGTQKPLDGSEKYFLELYDVYGEYYDNRTLRNGDASPWSYLITGKTLDEVAEKFSRHTEAYYSRQKEYEESRKKAEVQIKVYAKGYAAKNLYAIFGKAGGIEFQLSEFMNFKNDDEIKDYLRKNKVSFEDEFRTQRGALGRTEADWRKGAPVRPRKGTDWRGGVDATPESFLETFGFRGVEFGNWVAQGKNGMERQWLLNESFDAFCDLADLLHVPRKALSLEGTLGLCFGSRGRGGKASAHYESASRLINLTKTKGYSSLAHEWLHALDHYLAYTSFKEEGVFLSKKAKPSFESDEIRSELLKAWTDLGKAIDASAMSQRMEKKPNRKYWASDVEKAARCFEAFIEKSLEEKGVINDFLTQKAYSKDEKPFKSFYPYLDGKDVDKVCDAFKNVFQCLKTREKEGAVVLYSKAEGPVKGLKTHEVRRTLTDYFGEENIKTLLREDICSIQPTIKGAELTASLNRVARKLDPLTLQNSIGMREQAFYDPLIGRTYFVAENISKESAVPVFLHEVGVHMAHDSALCFKVEKMMDAAERMYFKGVADKEPLFKGIESTLQKAGVSTLSPYFREELAGKLIEETAKKDIQKPSVVRWVSDFKSAFNVWLVEHGVRDTGKLTTKDLVTMAKANVRELSRQAPEKKFHAELSPKGRELLRDYVRAMDEPGKTIRDTAPEIRGLYRAFAVLESQGKPLPEPPAINAPKRSGGMDR